MPVSTIESIGKMVRDAVLINFISDILKKDRNLINTVDSFTPVKWLSSM